MSEKETEEQPQEELNESTVNDDLFIQYFGYKPENVIEVTDDSVPDYFEELMPEPGAERPTEPATPTARRLAFDDMVTQRVLSKTAEKTRKYDIDKIRAEAKAEVVNAFHKGTLPITLENPTKFDRGLVSATTRALGRRKIDISGDDPDFKDLTVIEQDQLRQRKATDEIQRMLEDDFGGTLAKVWAGSEPMSPEDAAKSGIGIQKQEFFGRDIKEGVDPDVGFLEDPYIPYGIKKIPDLVERAVIKLGVENMFAPILLEDDEREAYIRETRASIPTANFERIVDVVEDGKDKGLSDEQIADQMRFEIGDLLKRQAYDDLPVRFQMKPPSVSEFKKEVEQNPTQFNMKSELVANAVAAVQDKKSNKEIQNRLNFVALGALPDSVLAGSIPATTDLAREAVKAANRIIQSKGDPGEAARVLEKAFGSLQFTEEKVGDEIVVVESTIGKLFRMLGVFTEGVAEADIPFQLITPASRDFYYGLGIRNPDSTWLARALANIETGNTGFTVHYTNEARKRGYARGTREYHAYLFVGTVLDFFVPWEKYHIQSVTTPTKAAWRGSRMVKAFNVPGHRARAFLSGASPFWYNHIYNVAKKVDVAADILKEQAGETPSIESLKALLDQDDLVQEAIKADKPAPLDAIGQEIMAFTLEQRRVATEVVKGMEEGLSFDEALDSAKKNYRPGLAESAADATEAIVMHLLHTEEAKLFQKTREDGGILPFEFEIQTRRVLRNAGLNPDEVFKVVFNQGSKNASRYLEALKVMSFVGDQETISLRNTPEYQKAAGQLQKLVDEGDLSPEEMTTLLSVMETRAVNEAAGNTSKISDPADFFGNMKVVSKKTKNADGSAGPVQKRIQVGNLLDIDKNNVAAIVSMFQKGDFIRLLDNDAEMLVDIMGKRFVSDYYRTLNTVENTGRSKKMPRNKLTSTGVSELEVYLRQQIRGAGTSGVNTSKANQVFANLASVYARMRGPAQSFINKEVIGALDLTLKPDRFFRNSLVSLNESAGYFEGKNVAITPGIVEITEGKKAVAGRKRIFADIIVKPEYVRQALGITNDMHSIDAMKAFSRSVGYVVGEFMKQQESRSAIAGMDLVPLGTNSFTRRENLRSIANKVNSRMATVLGVEKQSLISKKNFLDAKKLVKMIDPDNPDGLVLSPQQAANMKVLLRRLSLEPMLGKKMPQHLVGADADLTKISFEDYKKVIFFMEDLEAGSYARRTQYTEAIPRSLGYALLRALKTKAMSYQSISDLVDDYLKPVLRNFVLDDPLANTLPELREAMEQFLAGTQRIKPQMMRLMKEVQTKDADQAIDVIYDALRGQVTFTIDPDFAEILVGSPEILDVSGKVLKPSKKGLVDVLNEFTDAEIARFKQLDLAARKEGFDPMSFELRETAFGEDTVNAAEYSFASLTPSQQQKLFGVSNGKSSKIDIIETGDSTIGFLTKSSTQELLFKLISRFNKGFNGISEQVNTALSVLERHSTETGMTDVAIKAMTDAERYELSSALTTIQRQLQKNKNVIVESGGDLLEALGGKELGLRALGDEYAAHAYRLFAEGQDGWKQLYTILVREGGEGLNLAKGTDYSPAVAFLEMTQRLMVRESLMGLYDGLIRAGMPDVDDAIYNRPQPNISTTGAKHSIDAPDAFYERVKAYMDMIFRESRDVRQTIKADKDSPPIRLQPKQPRGSEFDYRFAAGENPFGTTFRGKNADFMDTRAEIVAEELLARFGQRTRGGSSKSQGSYVNYTFPDGSVAFIPQGMADAIEDAINRTSIIGQAKGSSAARALPIEDVGAPMLSEIDADLPFMQQEGSRKVRTVERTMAGAIKKLIDLFPMSFMHIKRGLTTGFVIPNPGYYVANFLGGALQLATGAGPILTTRILLRHPKMVGAVVGRMYGDGTHRPFGTQIIVAKNGAIYSADQIADMAVTARLKSSLIQSETQRAMADDVKQYVRLNENALNKVENLVRGINDHLAEVATALDNFYRVATFVDQIVEGASVSSAASLARKVAFDYGALTDFEKSTMRNVIIFYSYLKKNSELFFDTLVTKPWNIANQLRLTGGLQEANLSEDPEVVVNQWLRDRAGVYFTTALKNQAYASDKMTVLPMTPLMDTLGLVLNLYEGAYGDKDSQRALLTKFAPWVQAPFVLGTEFDIFYGQPLGDFNEVPPWLIEWDLAVTGGQLYELFEITYQKKRNPRSRVVEGDEHRSYPQAGNGKAWWIFRNLIQLPGAGRSMSWMTQLDRSDIGIMEGITEILRNVRLQAEEMGIASERDREFQDGDLMDPRVNMTKFDELLGVFNVRVQILPTKSKVRDDYFRNMQYEEREHKKSVDIYERMIKESPIPRDDYR